MRGHFWTRQTWPSGRPAPSPPRPACLGCPSPVGCALSGSPLSSPVPLPWASWRRCRAVLEPNHTAHHGRCDLRPHGPGVEHALERGMEVVRWTTDLRVEGAR